MILIICIISLFYSQVFSQNDSSGQKGIYSPVNIKKFADFLFCTEDYLRAALEYEKYLNINFNDTVEFKIGLAYSYTENYKRSESWFKRVNKSSHYFNDAQDQYFKSLFESGDYYSMRNDFVNKFNISETARKLYYLSYLFTGDKLPPQKDFFSSFSPGEKMTVKKFYLEKKNPPYKSETAAVIMSILIPGTGKIYSGHLGDGIIAAIATGLCGYLAYDNFKAEHNFRGWIFSGLTAFFYAGNIYGSAASAQIYNAGIQFDFEKDVKLFLKKQNYFMPEYGFCR